MRRCHRPLTYRPARKHTYQSKVRISQLPDSVDGVHGTGGKIEVVPVPIKDAGGDLLPTAIPSVTFLKSGRYMPADRRGLSGIRNGHPGAHRANLKVAPLAGFVAEGTAPFGSLTNAIEAALMRGLCSGMPFVKVGRGNAEGMVPRNPPYLYISGTNMTANKARLLLMGAMMKLGRCRRPPTRSIRPGMSPPRSRRSSTSTRRSSTRTDRVVSSQSSVFSDEHILVRTDN